MTIIIIRLLVHFNDVRRNMFARFPDQLLLGLVSWRSPREYLMINAEMLSGFYPTRLGVLLCSVVLGCRYTPNATGPCMHGASFITGFMLEYNIAHRRSIAVLLTRCPSLWFSTRAVHTDATKWFTLAVQMGRQK